MRNFNNSYLISICLFTLISITTRGQTNVSGFINANTLWSLGGSPYIVIGNVLLSHGYTLTIEPGVVIKFNTDKALQIDGELIAIGTSQNRITFTTNQSNASSGDWAKIHFADTCEDAVFNIFGQYTSGCIMKYCDVLYAGGIGFGAIHNESSSPYISCCNIFNSASSGVYCNGYITIPSFNIDSSAIKNCGGYGIYCTQFYGFSIISDTLENNMGGINIDASYPGVISREISNCFFIDNLGYPTLHLNHNMSSLIISSNYFINNSGLEIIRSSELTNQTNIYINCNHFLNNQPTANIVNIRGPLKGTINNNIFDGNASTSGSICSTIINFLSSSVYEIKGNIFRNNFSLLAPCFTFTLSPGLSLEYNEFSNNSSTNTVYLNCFANGFGFKHNNFINPNCVYELYNTSAYGLANINADSNYWGSTSTLHIDSVIYDYFDFANQSVVYYAPILNSPVFIDTTCSSNPTSIISIERKQSSILYPNPASSYFIISLENIANEGILKIYNILGEIIYQSAFSHSNKVEINVSDFAEGIYLVNVNSEFGNFTKRLVVSREK